MGRGRGRRGRAGRRSRPRRGWRRRCRRGGSCGRGRPPRPGSRGRRPRWGPDRRWGWEGAAAGEGGEVGEAQLELHGAGAQAGTAQAAHDAGSLVGDGLGEGVRVGEVLGEGLLGGDGLRFAGEVDGAVVPPPRARRKNHSPRTPKRSIIQGRGRWASSPMVFTPALVRRSAVRGPTPQRSRMGSGARKARSRPGGRG